MTYFGLVETMKWIFLANSNYKQVVDNEMHLPRATLALVASWLIQKETQDSMTIKILGR